MTAARSAGEAIDLELYGQTCDRCDRLSRRMGPPVAKSGPQSFRDRFRAAREGRA